MSSTTGLFDPPGPIEDEEGYEDWLSNKDKMLASIMDDLDGTDVTITGFIYDILDGG